MASVNEMRESIIKAYPGDNWKLKCQMMPDSQVMAIWFSLRDRKKDIPMTKPKKKRKEPEIEQLTMFDLGLIPLYETNKRSKIDEVNLYLEAIKR